MSTERSQCQQCGSSLASDETAFGVCMKCNTTAIAEPGLAQQAHAMASDPKEEVGIRSNYVPEPIVGTSSEDESTPSIVREYHDSFLRIFLFILFLYAFLIIFFVFLLLLLSTCLWCGLV